MNNDNRHSDTPDTDDNQTEASFENRIDLSGIAQLTEKLRSEIQKVIIGQESMINLLICAFLADGHVLIEGVPGVAKTLTARLFAKSINTGFSRIQFTPDLMPSDIIGTSVFNAKTGQFDFKNGPVFSNLVLIDEINRAPAKTQAALFEVMQEKQITFDGTTYELPSPFMVIATQNPIEHEGTYRLPEAQLDRFLFKINVGYPDTEQEISILESNFRRKNLPELGMMDEVVTAEEILTQRALIAGVHVEKSIMRYIAQIVQKTRNSSSVYLGASPRASVFLMKAAQAHAAMNERGFVTPDDVKKVLHPVMSHRILLTPEQEMEGVTPEQVLTLIADSIEIPR